MAELPVFDGGTYPASGSAIDKTEVLFISRADLRAICLEHPDRPVFVNRRSGQVGCAGYASREGSADGARGIEPMDRVE